MLFGDLTYEEVREAAANPASVVVVPTGCTEQQGPHLTVDFDSWLVTCVALASSEWAGEHHAVTAVVLPTLPFGPTPEHRNLGSGFVDLPQHVHEQVVAAVLDSMFDQGFRRFVIWRGCGQHDLRVAVEQFKAQRGTHALVRQPSLPYEEIWQRVGISSVVGGHADSFATALALFLRPSHVRPERVSNPHSGAVPWNRADLDLARYTRSGVIGDPTHATAELGERLWREIVPCVGREIVDVSIAPLARGG